MAWVWTNRCSSAVIKAFLVPSQVEHTHLSLVCVPYEGHLKFEFWGESVTPWDRLGRVHERLFRWLLKSHICVTDVRKLLPHSFQYTVGDWDSISLAQSPMCPGCEGLICCLSKALLALTVWSVGWEISTLKHMRDVLHLSRVQTMVIKSRVLRHTCIAF